MVKNNGQKKRNELGGPSRFCTCAVCRGNIIMLYEVPCTIENLEIHNKNV